MKANLSSEEAKFLPTTKTLQTRHVCFYFEPALQADNICKDALFVVAQSVSL